jgi:hypothetical protein
LSASFSWFEDEPAAAPFAPHTCERRNPNRRAP